MLAVAVVEAVSCGALAKPLGEGTVAARWFAEDGGRKVAVKARW
jgi:hypothetical protein